MKDNLLPVNNMTNNTVPQLDHGQTGELRYWCFVLLLVPAVTLFGNILVVLSVVKERSLRNATNWFIVSLATADIILALLVMPIATWIEHCAEKTEHP
ncbi:hypothetical protein EG68_02498 [Paragonimus skrjabini miyazakii]|uniref:G-protein coupled receptors family 1 profile domain-containing protein n=1 Tax=Paragonimus skrjabini miyazakii TaxID=59628 RepID=A0A8S9Z3U5_9TREM|nr:hypothetical protein EG68_02498 [Paragonimus skrjabini miyazakii]